MYPFDGPIRLLIGMSPWQVAISLRGCKLGNEAVQAEWIGGDNQTDIQENFLALLEIGSSYRLQIEHQFEHLCFPVVNVDILGSTPSRVGYSFDFRLMSEGEDYHLLLEELKDRTDVPIENGQSQSS